MKKLVILGVLAYGAYAFFGSRRQFAVIMPNGDTLVFDAIVPELDQALRQGGIPVILEGGDIVHTYTASQFMGGWLLDNCPLNVIFDQVWLEGQNDALTDANLQPYCEIP